MVTVIEIGGKQYCIVPNQKIKIDRLAVPEQGTLSLTNLLTSDPVTIEVVSHKLDDKVIARKFRNKTRYHRVKGHRQPVSFIQLKEAAPAKKRTAKAADEASKDS
jgi:large subunit ribosomal protein L21